MVLQVIQRAFIDPKNPDLGRLPLQIPTGEQYGSALMVLDDYSIWNDRGDVKIKTNIYKNSQMAINNIASLIYLLFANESIKIVVRFGNTETTTTQNNDVRDLLIGDEFEGKFSAPDYKQNIIITPIGLTKIFTILGISDEWENKIYYLNLETGIISEKPPV